MKTKNQWVYDVYSLARKHKIKLEVDELFLYDYKVYQADFLVKERNETFEGELCCKKGFSLSIYEQENNKWKIRMLNRSSLL
jgi:hypothetical protein